MVYIERVHRDAVCSHPSAHPVEKSCESIIYSYVTIRAYYTCSNYEVKTFIVSVDEHKICHIYVLHSYIIICIRRTRGVQ